MNLNKETVLKQLNNDYGKAIANGSFPTDQIILEPVFDTMIPIGGSKVGGGPDLPDDIEWPTWKDYDMTFIAHINLVG